MSMFDLVYVPVACLGIAMTVSLFHGLGIELAAALPGTMGTDFTQIMNIGYGIIEGACVFVFFFYYFVAIINAWRTRSNTIFVGVQVIYGICALFIQPIISTMFSDFAASSPIFGYSPASVVAFFDKLPVIALIIFAILLIVQNFRGKDYASI